LLERDKMANCSCGYSTAYPVCNGTHKTVQKVVQNVSNAIIKELEANGFTEAAALIKNKK